MEDLKQAGENKMKLQSLVFARRPMLRKRLGELLGDHPGIAPPIFGDPLGDWKAELEDCKADVAFLAVEEEGSGFDIARYLEQNFPLTLIIFIGKPEWAFQAFSFGPLDYLPEEFSLVRFQTALQRLQKDRLFPISKRPIRIQEIDGLGYRGNGSFHKLHFADILYIERVNRKVVFHMTGYNVETRKYSLNFLESTLSSVGFYRVHQSFLVNFSRIMSLRQCDTKETYELSLEGCQEEIPVSREKAHMLFDALGDSLLLL